MIMEGRGYRRREIGGNDESSFEIARGYVLAQFHGWEEMALPKERNHPYLAFADRKSVV